MDNLTIPLGVARSIAATSWYRKEPEPEPGTPGYVARDRIKIITEPHRAKQRWCRTFTLPDRDVVEEFLDGAHAAIDHARDTGGGLAQLQEFAATLEQAIERAKVREATRAREDAAQAELSKMRAREGRTSAREKTLSGQVESGRNRTLREIGEDYGVDHKDDQIRAALIAAYHAGVRHYRTIINDVLVVDAAPVPDAHMDKLKTDDAVTFTKAREAASGSPASTEETPAA